MQSWPNYVRVFPISHRPVHRLSARSLQPAGAPPRRRQGGARARPGVPARRMTGPVSPFKGKTGLQRVLNAAGYSWAGLTAAFRHEDAFRQEVFLAALLIPLGLYLGENGLERALMVGAVLGVLIVELLNSSIEAAVDRISLEHHELIKRAKDMGSAAVMIALINVAVVWALALLG